MLYLVGYINFVRFTDFIRRIFMNNMYIKNKSSLNIVIIGFMGTGKSTVSDCLEKMTVMEKIDSDSYIVERYGMEISDIFEKYGENHFRELETEAVAEIASKESVIVSCGGGVPLREKNAELLKANGVVVLLKAGPKVILERVKDSDSRPILNNNMNADFIKSLMDKRADKYNSAADIIVDTDNKSVKEVCDEIIRRISDFKFENK